MGAATEISAKVSDMKDSAEALARAAGKKMDEVGKKLDDVRAGTADVLHSAASTIRTTGRHSAEAIGDFTAGAAQKLDAAGTFVEKHRLRQIPENVRRAVRKNPGGAVVLAAAFGFLTAMVFRAMTHTCQPE